MTDPTMTPAAAPVPPVQHDSNGQLIVSALIVLALSIIALTLVASLAVLCWEEKADLSKAGAEIGMLTTPLAGIIGILGNALQAPSGISNVVRAVTSKSQ
jgi:hypothetical protein